MPPEQRRRQIVAAARRLIADRGSIDVSTADVARAAGVARSLVHHYFAGIDDLLDAVAESLVVAVSGVLVSGADIPDPERIHHNVGAWMDLAESNRALWLALAWAPEPVERSAGLRHLRETIIDGILEDAAGSVEDTSWARVCLDGYVSFAEALGRRWLNGEASREDTARALSGVLLHMIRETIPEGNAPRPRKRRSAGSDSSKPGSGRAQRSADRPRRRG